MALRALIDGDILRYELGFAAEAGWKAITGTDNVMPPFNYVEDLLQQRIAYIMAQTTATEYTLFLTEGRTFRHDIAKTKPYKGQRVSNKPRHFDNLTAYMLGVLPNKLCNDGLEADDHMAIAAMAAPESSIICSRDKDLRTITGAMVYSWELGKQPSYGPRLVASPGSLTISEDGKKLTGDGYAFFAGQCLIGDRVDNVPGAAGVGPIGAMSVLAECKTPDELEQALMGEYERVYKDSAVEMLTEQASLLWIIRRFDEAGKPVLWKQGVYT